MNAKQRNEIMLCQRNISLQVQKLEQIHDEAQESYDNLPEGLQQAENGIQAEQDLEYLNDALSSLEEADGHLSNL